MPLTDIAKLKEYVEQKNLKEKEEREYLVDHLLNYREMNDVVCQQKHLPRIEKFNDRSLLAGIIKWTWDRKKLISLPLDDLRNLSRRAESWDRFISQIVSAKREDKK